jgi:ADP-ribose pyrophosphatase YjhB (NUDIX family)
MSHLRLGVLCAVTDDNQQLLLSQRADLGIWTLPGGRLDAGEWLEKAAAREAREETGIQAEITHPIGLYYLAGWRRMNVLFAARAQGGEVLGRTDETRDNGFFEPVGLVESLARTQGTHTAAPLHVPIEDALAAQRPPPRVITTSSGQRQRMRWAFARRYAWNWLRGKREARFPVFDVSVAALVWDEAHVRLLTVKHGKARALPRVHCAGTSAPWAQLGRAIHEACGLNVALHWVGLWQDAARDRLEFVFAATTREMPLFRAGEWTTARSAALPDRDMAYVVRTRSTYARDPVWLLRHDDSLDAGDTLYWA